MIKVINTRGEVMDPGSAIGIPIERNNPLFNDADKFFQDITYPGKAPMSPQNKAFFGNGQRVDADSAAYEFPVQVYVSGTHYFSGILKYKVVGEEYDYLLKINFGAIAEKVKNTRLPEIRTTDGLYHPEWTAAQWEDHMKDTCEHPENYPYAFFPVFNDGIPDYSEFEPVAETTNLYDAAAGRFKIEPPNGWIHGLDYYTCNTHFYKITYILERVIEYLGLKATGSFFSDENEQLYIFSRYNVTDYDNDFDNEIYKVFLHIHMSMYYMPNITILDFLKAIRMRFNASFSFDLIAGTVQVDTFKSIVNIDDYIDISEHIEEISELEPIETKGYSITLAADSEDPLFSVGDNIEPTNRLVIGDGSSEVEINCGTLKAKDETMVATQQDVRYQWPAIGTADFTRVNNWPLRLVRFKGMQMVSGNLVPVSEPFELSVDDALLQEFLLDAKRIVVKGSIPHTVLSKLDGVAKLRFKSKEGTVIKFLNEKLKYTLGERSLISATFEGYSMLGRIRQASEILPYKQEMDTGRYNNTVDIFKVYFDTERTGIQEVTPEAYKEGFTITADTVTKPTDNGGGGGEQGVIRSDVRILEYSTYELRIRGMKPKFADRLGTRYTFNQGPGYWYAHVDELAGFAYKYGVTGALWIVF